MNIVSLSTKYVYPLLIALAVISLYRGHNLPGGGFIGGLLAASAVMLHALTSDWEQALRRLRVSPEQLMAGGLLLATFSGIFALGGGEPFMTARWMETFYLPLLGKVKLGTPFLFDIGVFFAVIGFTTKCAYSLGTYKY